MVEFADKLLLCPIGVIIVGFIIFMLNGILGIWSIIVGTIISLLGLVILFILVIAMTTYSQ